MTRRSPRHDLDNWLDRHGYRHAHSQKSKMTGEKVLARQRRTCPGHATKVTKISNKDPSSMTAGEINKELDKLEEQNSKLGQLMIDAGRGFERPVELMIDVGHQYNKLTSYWAHRHVNTQRKTLFRDFVDLDCVGFVMSPMVNRSAAIKLRILFLRSVMSVRRSNEV